MLSLMVTALLCGVALLQSPPASAQSANQPQLNPTDTPRTDADEKRRGDTPRPRARRAPVMTDCGPSNPSSNIRLPAGRECSDTRFYVDSDTGLDTGCTFRNSGPLTFNIRIDRYVGDKMKLIQNGLLGRPGGTTQGGLSGRLVALRIPAFDVDYAGASGVQPERDKVSLNGVELRDSQGQIVYLLGSNNVWHLNEIQVPVEYVHFPNAPGQVADNIVRIDIDTFNTTQEAWCTAADWGTLDIQVPRPALLVHGILSTPATWGTTWASDLTAAPCPTPLPSGNRGLDNLGLPYNTIDLGSLPQTIQANSAAISNRVTALKQCWKVDKINLIGHSKGGLDSRDFTENSDSVAQVIQIGTPNTGSPLADALVNGSTVLAFFYPVARTINLLAQVNAPGGYQLTQSYMGRYNAQHGFNPNVRYTALAGLYDPDCFFCLNRGLQGIVGNGDLIVPLDSVHGLPYTNNLTFSTVGGPCSFIFGLTDPRCDSIHTRQTSSQPIFNALQTTVRRFDPPGSNVSEATFPATEISKNALTGGPPPLPTLSRVNVIQQGQRQTHTLAVDQNARVFFTLLYPSGNLDLALISPSGQRFDRATIVGNPNVQVEDIEIPGGRLEMFTFTALEAGIWTAEIDALSVVETSGQASYAVSAWMETSPLTLAGSFQNANIAVNAPLQLRATLRNNTAPITGATASALVSLPNNTVQQIALRDDGINGDTTANDGIYSANFTNTTNPGTYRVLYQAERNAGGGLPAFSREVLQAATVSRSASTFTGTFTSAGLDTNANSLFDQLRVQATLNITQDGTYRLLGTLTDTAGNTHQAKALATLTTGTRTVNLDFDGARLYRNRVNGPYRLSSVTLIEENAGESMSLETRTDAHNTTALQFRAFEHDPIVFTGNGSAVGVDTNSNGLFDLLRATLEMDIATAGFYNWTAQLIDPNGRDLGFANGSGNLIAGNNNLVFNFDGSRVGQNGVDGPYRVTGLLVYAGNFSLIQEEVLTTPALRATQFEGRSCPATINPASQTFPVGGGNGQVAVTISQDCPWNSLVTPVPVGGSNPFSNTQAITIRDATTAQPYPATIGVSGLSGGISRVRVTLSGLSHTFPDDVDIMLVGPGGQRAVLMSDAGGSPDVSNLNLTFDQAATNTLPDENILTTGTYRPANYETTDNFPAPGPGSGTFAADLSVFNGTNPNGTWQLLVVDDAGVDTGAIANGWSLDINTAVAPAWLNITSGGTGTGAGNMAYSVAANNTGSARSATLTIAGQTFTVTQAGTTATTMQFNFASYTVNESDGLAQLAVTRTGDASGPATVSYKTEDDFTFRECNATGSVANQRCDYGVGSGQLSFAAGETGKTIEILINDDFYVETNETINLTLSNPNGATLGGQSTATLTIQDNDTALPTNRLYVAYLNGAQATPPNNSPGTGIGTLLLNAGETSAQVSLSFGNLGSAQTSALIHGFAPATQTANVLFGLPAGTVSNFNITLTPAQVQQLKAGNLYFNVSTVNFGSGEIRGQILANHIDDPRFFVQNLYSDFLVRRPDAGGLDYWTGQIAQVCGSNLSCIHQRRIAVSAAFFIELEFQESGAFVYRLYKAAFGEQTGYRPTYAQFTPDRARVVGGTSLNQGKLDFANLFTARPEFTNRYPSGLTPAQFVDAILTTAQQGAGVTYTSAQRQAFINDVTTGGRGQMLKNLADETAFKAAVFNRAFVLTQYFGYLRRDPDQAGYDFWVGVLNGQPNNFSGMVCAFLTSTEYQQRFSPVAYRSNSDCSANLPQ